MQDNNISDIIKASLENAKGMLGNDTVIGDPIETSSGTTIIPLSKVTVGIASGGIDYDSKKHVTKNFGGGGGTGIVVMPIGFLIVKADGTVEMMNINSTSSPASQELSDIICSLLQKTPELICKIKKSVKDKKEAEKEEEKAENDE